MNAKTFCSPKILSSISLLFLKRFVGPWSRCSGDCFNLTKGRAIVCIKNDAFADDNECNGDEKPLTLEKCRMDEIDYCRPKWHYSDWSECSKKCGGGTQRRVVKCVEPIENDGIMKESQNCRFAEREAIYRTCNEEKCEGIIFITQILK